MGKSRCTSRKHMSEDLKPDKCGEAVAAYFAHICWVGRICRLCWVATSFSVVLAKVVPVSLLKQEHKGAL